KQAARKDFIYVERVAFSPDRKKLAVCDEYTLSLKNVETGETITRLDFQGDSIGSAVFTPDSRTLAVVPRGLGWGAFIRFIRFIDASTGLERCDFKTTREWTGSLAFSCDGKFVALREMNASPPKGLLSSLCKFLGLDWKDDMLRIQDLATVLESGEK